MIISTQTAVLSGEFGDKEAIKIIAEAGFDAFDYSFSDWDLYELKEKEKELLSGDFIGYAKELRKFADDCGIICNQAHAPFPSSRGTDEDEEIFEYITRSMEFAATLGAKVIVVHPKQHIYHLDNVEELFWINVEFYKSLAPYCEKFGIKVAIENMWHENPNTYAVVDSACSRAWEFKKLLDTVDSPWITGCLDIGHASLIGADIPAFIKTLGKERLSALHIHDTDLVHDLHTLPLTQKIDYYEVMCALGEIGYDGDFTYEADGFLRGFPADFYPEAVSFMLKVAKRLIKWLE